MPALAVPGDQAWDSAWALGFEDRDVTIVMDADRAGRLAAQRIQRDSPTSRAPSPSPLAPIARTATPHDAPGSPPSHRQGPTCSTGHPEHAGPQPPPAIRASRSPRPPAVGVGRPPSVGGCCGLSPSTRPPGRVGGYERGLLPLCPGLLLSHEPGEPGGDRVGQLGGLPVAGRLLAAGARSDVDPVPAPHPLAQAARCLVEASRCSRRSSRGVAPACGALRRAELRRRRGRAWRLPSAGPGSRGSPRAPCASDGLSPSPASGRH